MITVKPIVNRIFSSVTYILSDGSSDYIWLVDCGDYDVVRTIIGEKKIAGVLLTHAHFDHIYGLPALLKDFPRCTIVSNGCGTDALANARLNLSLYHGTPVEVSPHHLAVLEDRQRLPLFRHSEVIAYEMPGHNPSCLSFVIDGCLFTGDALIPGEKVVTNLPGGNKDLARVSVEKIISLSVGKQIYPGHSIQG